MTVKQFLKKTGSIILYDKAEQKEIEAMAYEFLTVRELYALLGGLVANGNGDEPVLVKVSNEDNEGIEYEGDYALASKDYSEICFGSVRLEPLSAIEDSNIAKYIL